LTSVRCLLSEPRKAYLRVIRLSKLNEEVIGLLQKYYEAVDVVQRDTPAALESTVSGPSSGIWLAYLEGCPVGCVVLRKLETMTDAGECKRLYVQPKARGDRIADKLLELLEEFARREGLRAIYLDSYDDLKAAVALYQKRGYLPCERYNSNPQATLFLRKGLTSPSFEHS